MEQSGTRVEQVRGHMGQWAGTFLPFRFCLQWASEGLKMAKNVLCGHKQLWRPQMGGTKWNKGGTSKGTYGPVGWDLFAIQILPSVGSRGAEYGETAPAVPRNPCS